MDPQRAADISRLLDEVSVGETNADIVWHYTRPAGLVPMLTGNLIWACDSHGMNDKTELRTGRDALVRALAAATFPHPDLKHRVSELLAHCRREMERSTTFILSASLDGDSLNQWKEYAGRDGYALGFKVFRGNMNLLEKHPFAKTPGNLRDQSQYVSSWRDVIYTRAGHDKTAAGFVDLLARMLDPDAFSAEPPEGITNDYTAELFAPAPYAAIVTRLKNANSSGENETRITATTRDPDRFHGHTPAGRPKVDLTGHTRPPGGITGTSTFTSTAPTPLPIVEIRTGPDAEVTGLRQLLDRTGYGHVRISASKPPHS